MSGKGASAPPAAASQVIKEAADAASKKDLKHVPAPSGGLSQAEKEAYLAEKNKKPEQ